MLKQLLSQSKSVLITGFMTVLMVMSSITVYAISRINDSNESIQKLEENSEILQKTILMRDTYYNRGRLLSNMAINGKVNAPDGVYEEYKNDLIEAEQLLLFLRQSIKTATDSGYLYAILKNTTAAKILEKRVIK